VKNEAVKRTFIPPNYPKSFIIAMSAVMLALAAGGVAFLGYWLESAALVTIARYAFFACWGVATVMFVIFIPNTWAGKYRNLPSRPWRDQVW
jgi:hypothetical protein